MNYLRLIGAFAGLFSLPLTAGAASAQAAGPDLLPRFNIEWTTQSKNSGESMPCGGFDMGANLWVENNQVLMYLDRSGSFDENNQMLKLGRLRFSFDRNPFEKSFSQKLDLATGRVVINGDNGFQMTVWFDTGKPVCHVEAKADQPIAITAQYESWRTAERELSYGEIGTGERIAASSYVAYPGKIFTYPDIVGGGANDITFYHRNRDDKLLFDRLVKQQDLGSISGQLWNPQKTLTFGGRLVGKDCTPVGTSKGEYAGIPFTGYGLQSKPGKSHLFMLCAQTSQEPTIATWKAKLDQLCALADRDSLADKASLQWWNDYWKRSWIEINPGKDASDIGFQIGRNAALFRYMLGCNARGDYPTKFNGGLFTVDPVFSGAEGQTFTPGGTRHQGKTPDFRMWGGGTFTAQNQRLVYWPMLKSGDFDLMAPQFNFYLRALNNAELRTQEYWKHGGCSFNEQIENFGLPIGWVYGWPDSPWKPFSRKPDFPRGDLVDRTTGYHYSTQLEFSFMMLQYHRYTGADIRGYLPFVKSCVTFYFQHYQMRNKAKTGRPFGDDGKLVISPSTALESYKDALNPTDAVAGLRAVLTGLIAISDNQEAQQFRAMLAQVPEVGRGKVDGQEAFLPAHKWTTINNVELPQLYPVFPYDLCDLGREDLAIGINTWKTAPASQKDFISWHQDGIFTARLGLTQDATEILVKKMGDSGRRFPAFWGPGHDWVPDHNWGGSGLIGLQEMLLQTPGDKILLLPSWPKNWDVSFKLHAPGNTTVECVYSNGHIEKLMVLPASRAKDIVRPSQ